MAQEKVEPKFETLLGRMAMLAYDKIPELTVKELVENFTPEFSALKTLSEEEAWKAIEELVDEKVREKAKPPKPPKPPRKAPPEVKVEELEERKRRFLERWFSLL